jgi:hypothetical protein
VTRFGGASAVPAGVGLVTLAFGQLRHHPAGTKTGARGASLDWDRRGAGVMPVEKREVSAPRLGRPYRIERSGQVPGSMA